VTSSSLRPRPCTPFTARGARSTAPWYQFTTHKTIVFQQHLKYQRLVSRINSIDAHILEKITLFRFLHLCTFYSSSRTNYITTHTHGEEHDGAQRMLRAPPLLLLGLPPRRCSPARPAPPARPHGSCTSGSSLARACCSRTKPLVFLRVVDGLTLSGRRRGSLLI
jgi:hypothetical protein